MILVRIANRVMGNEQAKPIRQGGLSVRFRQRARMCALPGLVNRCGGRSRERLAVVLSASRDRGGGGGKRAEGSGLGPEITQHPGNLAERCGADFVLIFVKTGDRPASVLQRVGFQRMCQRIYPSKVRDAVASIDGHFNDAVLLLRARRQHFANPVRDPFEALILRVLGIRSRASRRCRVPAPRCRGRNGFPARR